MNVRRVILIAVAAVVTVSCSEKSSSDRNRKREDAKEKLRQELRSSASGENAGQVAAETDAEPDASQIGEDCVAFLRSTNTVAPNRGNTDCPECPVSEATHEVLKFDHMQIDRVSFSGSTCDVTVRILATFNPSRGEAIVGGLTGWISPEQRLAYSRGETPSGQQVYTVKVTYRRTGKGWRALEFH